MTKAMHEDASTKVRVNRRERERERGDFQCESWSASGLSTQPTANHYRARGFV